MFVEISRINISKINQKVEVEWDWCRALIKIDKVFTLR